MKHKIIDQYYKGNALNAYELFGAHLCEERGKKGVRFNVFAPHAQSIQVIGSFNDWSCQGYMMKRADEKGIWTLFIPGVKEGDMYKYRITQATGRVVDKMDPYAFYSELRPNTASIVVNLEYKKWSDEKWISQRDKNFDKPLNIYEVHLGSWKKEEGQEWVNYKTIAKELIAYVKKQNFTHIELMPLNEYPFDGSWGYQCSGYFSATSRYGSCQDLMYLINACHKAGIGVIMDYVPVHFVKDDFSLSYFDGTPLYEYEKPQDADSQWGTANFNLWKEEVRSFLMSAAAFWIDKYHVDGLRMDAISNIIHWHGNKDLGENEGALYFIKRMNYNLHTKFPNVMLIAEDSSDFADVTKPTIDGGLGFDYKWDLGWMNDTLKYLEKDPIYRKWHHHDITFSMAYFYSERFMVEFSHDEVVHGKATILQKMWGEYDLKFQQAKTLYTYMYTHPGKKLNFMGNEIGQFREWDEEKECDWMLLDYPKHQDFHRFIKDLNQIYINEPAFFNGDYNSANFRWIEVEAVEERVYIYERMYGEDHFIIVLNMSDEQYNDFEFGYDHYAVLHEVLSGERKEYGGYFDGSKADILAELTGYKWWKRKFKITIPALAAIIYKVEFLPEPKEIPLPMLDEASLDIDRKRFRTEHEIRAEHEN